MGKNVDYESPKKKKKKNGCLSCLLTLFVISFVFNTLILTAGGIVGHYFTTKYIDMSIFDVAGVGWDLIKFPSSKKIVTNKYNDNNKNDFNKELKKQLFLKESVNLDVSDILDVVLDKKTTLKNEKNKLSESLWVYTKTLPAINNAETGGVTEGETDVMTDLINMIADLYTEENIDKERLKQFDESNYSDYLFGLNDKQLASVLDSVIVSMLAQSGDFGLGSIGIDDPSSIINLEQIIFDRGKHTLVSGEGMGTTADVTTLKVTMSLGIEDIAVAAIKQIPSVNGFVDFLSQTCLPGVAKLMLPENVYVSALMGLDGDIGGKVYYNNMDDKDVEKAFKLISNSAKAAGTDIDVQKLINESITSYVAPILDKAGEWIDFSAENDGTIKVDLFETIVTAANLNEGAAEGDELTGKDVVATLAGIIGSDAEAAINEQTTWQDQYFDKDGNIVYKPANFNELERVDFEKLFLDEVASKYLLNIKGEDNIAGTADDVTFSQLMAMFGIGTAAGGEIDLMKLFDSARMAEIAEADPDSIRVNIDDRMLGAIVNSQIGSLMGANGSLTAYDPQVKQVMITTSNVSGIEHSFMEIGLTVKTDAMFGQISGFGNILSALIGDEIMISLKADITPTAKLNGTEKVAATLKYNNLTEKETEKILRTVGKVAAELSIEQLLAEIQGPITELIDSMESVMPGISFVQSAIKMPNVFDTVTQLLLKDSVTGQPVVTGKEFQAVIGAMTEDVSGIVTNPAKANYDGFLADITDKYYINANISSFNDLFNTVANTGSFDINKFRMNDGNGKKGLFNDDRSPLALKPFLPDNEIAAVIKEMMNSGGDFSQLMDIKEFTIDDLGKIKMIIGIDISSLNLGEAASMLPVSKLYLTASVDTSSVLTQDVTGDKYYATALNINDMTRDEFLNLEKIMNVFAGGGGLDLNAKSTEIGKLIYDQFATISTALGMDIVFEDGGIELVSFYDFLAKALNVVTLPEYTADPALYKANIQKALQGLVEGSGQNNFSAGVIITNKIGATAPPSINLGTNVISDRQLGAVLKAAIAGAGSPISLEQVNIYAANCDDDYSFLQSFKEGINRNNEYIVLTFKLNTTGVIGSGALSGIVPQNIYFTVLLEKNGGAYSVQYTRINNMSEQVQKVFFQMISIDQSSVSDATSQCVDLLNSGYGSGVLTDYIGSGDADGKVCGQMTITVSLP